MAEVILTHKYHRVITNFLSEPYGSDYFKKLFSFKLYETKIINHQSLNSYLKEIEKEIYIKIKEFEYKSTKNANIGVVLNGELYNICFGTGYRGMLHDLVRFHKAIELSIITKSDITLDFIPSNFQEHREFNRYLCNKMDRFDPDETTFKKMNIGEILNSVSLFYEYGLIEFKENRIQFTEKGLRINKEPEEYGNLPEDFYFRTFIEYP